MRIALHLTVVFLVVAAGCGASPTPDPSTPTPEQATATPAGPPPGLSMETVTDTRSLVEAHRAVLDDESHTVSFQRTLRYPNETLYSRTNTTHRFGANETGLYESHVDGTKPLFLGGTTGGIERWNNETLSISRVTYNGGTRYQRGLAGQSGASFSTTYSVLAPFNLTTTGRTGTDAETRYHLSGELSETDAFAPSDALARNATVSASTDGDGVVRYYNLSYTTEIRGETVDVTRRMRVENIGETTVPRPEWVDTALNETRNQPR